MEETPQQPTQQTPGKKINKKVIIWVAGVGFLIILGVISVLILTGREKEVPNLSSSVPCENTDIDFNLISCEYVKSGIFHDSTVKIGRAHV